MLTQRLLALALLGTEWVIWLLLLLSIFSLAVILEKFIVLRRKRGNQQALRNKISAALKKADRQAIEQVLHSNSSSSAKVTLETMRNMKENSVDFEDSLAIALSEEKIGLESRIAILGTLGSNAPFVGLFGTVLGIIHAFHNLSMNTKGGPATVMAGISEALVATALGLFVAIPAVAAYNYFVRYIKKIMVAAENFARLVIVIYTSGK
jgi:biopolymer transport protein ExbB/TolQ